jgi:hypothetical protein
MAKVPPDYSFEREGLPLAQWLWRLVGADQATRLAAGEMLHAMSWGVSSPQTELEDIEPLPDSAGQSERFRAKVREVVGAGEFDTAGFVRRLGDYIVATSQDWHRRLAVASEEKDEAQYDRVAARLIARINAAGDEATREQLSKRLGRAICASTERKCEIDQRTCTDAEAISNARMMAASIFDSLGRELLAAPEALQVLLEHEPDSHQALSALARIGPEAIAFAPQLIERMDRMPDRLKKEHYSFGFAEAEALGSIGRGNAQIVDQLIARLRGPEWIIRAAAESTLSFMGTEVAGRENEILPLLHAMLDRRNDLPFSAALVALASVGRNDRPSRKRIIDLARPRPPEMVAWPDSPQHQSDRVMGERGQAIDAMRFFLDYPDECVPVLIDALDTFKEYDPDACYDGPLGRIAYALARFGPAAGTAALPLARHLADEEGEHPRAILDALAAMGPAAAAAIPLLEAYRQRVGGDEESDPVAEVLQTLRLATPVERD